MLLVSPLLPDEYLLRADYPGARIKTKTKIWRFRVRASGMMTSSADMVSSRMYISQHTRLQRQLGYRVSPANNLLAQSSSGIIQDSSNMENAKESDTLELNVEYKASELFDQSAVKLAKNLLRKKPIFLLGLRHFLFDIH
jgi:hypothetical protein